MIVWNKVGADGANAGSFNEPAAQFTIQPGSSQVVAFEPNTQGGFCDWTDEKKTANGQYDCPYGEFNIAPSTGSGAGWSAADVSTYNQDSAPEGEQNGKGQPCNLDISAQGGSGSSTCSENYYWAAAGTSGLSDDIGVVVPSSDEAHFDTIVSDMTAAS